MHKYLFAIPDETHAELARRCQAQGKTLRAYLLEAVAETGVPVHELQTKTEELESNDE
jgi:hypothetical protein